MCDVGGADLEGYSLNDRDAGLLLICRVQTRLCGLPLEHVLEIMRPLPTEPVAGAAHFVRGLAVIRGAPVPVVDTARLLGAEGAQADRFVTVNAGERRVALAVDSVLGVRAVPAGSLRELPPLLHEACADVVAAIGLLDAELLLVLHSARLLPDDARGTSDTPGAGA
jgi:purine-binding chemotaxis protein CheW